MSVFRWRYFTANVIRTLLCQVFATPFLRSKVPNPQFYT